MRFEDIDKPEMFGMDEAGIMTPPEDRSAAGRRLLDQDAEQLGIDTVVLENVPGSVATLGQREGRLRGDGGVP